MSFPSFAWKLPLRRTSRLSGGFLALRIEGSFAFDAIGILQSFLAPLAKASVPMFAVSTYDTDYIFIHEKHWFHALGALQQAGHELQQA